MYHNSQSYHTQPPPPPIPQYPHGYYPHNSQNQPWPQSAAPQLPPHPTESHQHLNAPPLPPKPELHTLSANQWGDTDFVSSPLPVSGTPSHYWPPQGVAESGTSVGMGARTYSLPVVTGVPRMGNAVPPEHVRLFDGGRSDGYDYGQQESSLSRATTIRPGPSGYGSEMAPYTLAPPTPQMPPSFPMPSISPMAQSSMSHMVNVSPGSDSQASLLSHSNPSLFRSPSSYFSPPPPPPSSMLSRHPTMSIPTPNHYPPQPPSQPPPPPPPLPAHYSEPQMHATQPQTPAPPSQTRQFSLPPLPPTPAPPTPAPSFPQPLFGAPHAHGRAESNIWVGGIAPRPSAPVRPPFQPDWNTMPSIPQAATPAPPSTYSAPAPAPPPIPPAPAPPHVGPTLQMPTPVMGSYGAAPPLPPLPPHTVTSPAIVTRGQWSGGPERVGTGPPLPPKEPVIPPKEPIVPPKEPLQPFPTRSPGDGPSSQRSSPLSSAEIAAEQVDDLRQALRLSLAVSPPIDEDEELQRVLELSMHDADTQRSSSNATLAINSSTEVNVILNAGSGAWTPEIARAQVTEPPSVYESKPPPPLPRQEVRSTPEQMRPTPEQAGPSRTGPLHSGPSRTPPVNLDSDEDADEPPPPAYEEVGNRRAEAPAAGHETREEPPVVSEPAHTSSSSGQALGTIRRTGARDNLQGARSSPEITAPPSQPVTIEVIPPGAQNSLSRRDPQQVVQRRAERSSSDGSLPAQMPFAPLRTGTPPRRSTESPPPVSSTLRPRASSQAQTRPATEPSRIVESGYPNVARQRVTSASANLTPAASRMGRVSMFFNKPGASLGSGLGDAPPRRNWAIDEESSSSGVVLLQAPEPVGGLSRLHSRNTSRANLQDGIADAPPVTTLLDGVSYGFRDPDPPTPIPMPPAKPLPPGIMIDQKAAFHFQTLNFRHLLHLLSHYGSTNLTAAPTAIAASKSGVYSLRVVLYFVRGVHDKDPWRCRLYLELHTPTPRENTSTIDTSLLWTDSTISAPVGPRGKIYIIPGPLPELPLSLQGLSVFITSRLDEACRAPSDSSQRRLERLLIECYGSVVGASANAEEIGGRQKGSGNLSIGGIFSRVKDKFSSDKGGTLNDHTYDLISPFQIDGYQ